MGASCGCHSPVRYRTVALACIECGTECCPCCTLMFESAPYCVACFGTVLENPAVAAEAAERARQFAQA